MEFVKSPNVAQTQFSYVMVDVSDVSLATECQMTVELASKTDVWATRLSILREDVRCAQLSLGPPKTAQLVVNLASRSLVLLTRSLLREDVSHAVSVS